MQKGIVLRWFYLACFVLFGLQSNAQNPPNWTDKQLMQPADLASALAANQPVPLIISVGPGATLPNSIHTGPAGDSTGLAQLKTRLQTTGKSDQIVVYCGCCPFEYCPNVRPAIRLLQQMHFTNYYLLNLPHNIKTDWIDKGYPVSGQ